jgi:hypothetical protein
LNKLSHSKRIVNLLGAQSDLKIDKTATGSVADISDQNNKHTKKGISNHINGKIKYSELDIIKDDIINQNTANQVIDFQLLISCL